MYQRAKRHSSLSNDHYIASAVLTAQAQSYLSAVNSLSLVAKDKQWILVSIGESEVKEREQQPNVSLV